jgi:hypothetical protein
MQLQKNNDQGVLSPPGDIICFNDAQPQMAPNISYDPIGGLLTLVQPGLYYVNWSVVAEDADPSNAEPLRITLVYGQKEITVESTAPADEVTGAGIIEIDSNVAQIYLRNDGDSFYYGSGMVVANLTISSIDMNDDTEPPEPIPDCGCGTVVNFSNGGIDPTNPITWPLIFQALQLSWVLHHCERMQEVCTHSELEKLLGLNEGVLSFILVSPTITPVLNTINDTLLTSINDLVALLSDNAGIVSMDAYIGHSTMGVVPSLATGDLPILSLVAGPPYPQIIARNGIISSFSAEYDALAAVDVSLFGAFQGALSVMNGIISSLAGAVGTLVATFASIAPMLAGLGSPLPSDYADILNRWILAEQSITTPSSNHHMHAVLWHAKRDAVNALGGAVNWQKVSDLDLGAIPFAELGPLDTILSTFGNIFSAGGNVVSTLLTLLGVRGTPNQALNSMPLSAESVTGLNHAVESGDYLMVQFTLMGNDNTTILAGVLASNLMASVLIR